MKLIFVFWVVVPHYHQMFESSMSESTEGVLRLDHVSPDVFNALLVFLYSGVVDVSSGFSAEIAASLLDLSHQYMIAELARACVYALRLAVNPSNCLELFLVSQRYHTPSYASAPLNDLCWVFALTYCVFLLVLLFCLLLGWKRRL